MLKFGGKDNGLPTLCEVSNQDNACHFAAGIDLEFHGLNIAACPIFEDDGERIATEYRRFAFP